MVSCMLLFVAGCVNVREMIFDRGMCLLLVGCVHCLLYVSFRLDSKQTKRTNRTSNNTAFCVVSGLVAHLWKIGAERSLLVEYAYCEYNVCIACGVCLLFVGCVYSLWHLLAAWGMFQLLIECVYCLKNVSSAC